MLLAVDDRPEPVGDELPVLGRDAGGGDPLHELLAVAAVTHEVGDRDDRQAVLGREAFQLRLAGHALFVLGDDLAQQPGRIAPGHAGEVERRLGVAGPLQDPARPVPEGKTWPGRARSAGLVSSLMSAWIVAARSPAEIPVVVP